jgi:hypothetical protein
MGEQAAAEFAEPLREQLRALLARDVQWPTEPRLVAYFEQAVAMLMEEGVWTQGKVDKIVR